MQQYNIPEHFSETDIDAVKINAAEFASGIDAIRYIRNSLMMSLKEAKDFYFAEVDRAGIEAHARKLRIEAAAPDLLEALEEVRELIDGYVDIRDGESGPLPNDAMRAQQVIDAVLAKARGE